MLNSIQAVALAVQNACFVPSCAQKSGFGPKSPRTAFGRVVALHGCFYNMLRVQVGLLPAETDELCGWLDKHKARESNSASKEKLAGCLCFRQ